MKKEKEPTKKRRRKGNAGCSPLAPRIKNVYHVGVYFPDRDVLNFFVEAHDFRLDVEGCSASFYNIGSVGMKEFVGRFTHVAYVLITDQMPKDQKELPEGFGKVS